MPMNSVDPKFATLPVWCAISGMSRTATYKALGKGELWVGWTSN